MPMSVDLTNIYRKYKGQWVALDQKLVKVLSSNKNAKVAYEQAVKRGYKVPTLFKVPSKNIPYVG